jgi:hypothetical protein
VEGGGWRVDFRFIYKKRNKKGILVENIDPRCPFYRKGKGR